MIRTFSVNRANKKAEHLANLALTNANEGVRVFENMNMHVVMQGVAYTTLKGKSLEGLSETQLTALTTAILEIVDPVYDTNKDTKSLATVVHREKEREKTGLFHGKYASLDNKDILNYCTTSYAVNAEQGVVADESLIAFYLVHFKFKYVHNIDLERIVQLIAQFSSDKPERKLRKAMKLMDADEKSAVADLAKYHTLQLFSTYDVYDVDRLNAARDYAYKVSPYANRIKAGYEKMTR